MIFWTYDLVTVWLEDAYRTLCRLPEKKQRGYFSTWPDFVRTPAELDAMTREPIKILPSAFDISRLDATLEWIFFVDDADIRKIVFERARRVPWKTVAQYRGLSIYQARKKRNIGLWAIMMGLNSPRATLFSKNQDLLSKYLYRLKILTVISHG